jgi:hypothetical protein
MVVSLLLRASPLDTGASIIFLLPQVSSSRDRAYQTIITVRVEIKGSAVA